MHKPTNDVHPAGRQYGLARLSVVLAVTVAVGVGCTRSAAPSASNTSVVPSTTPPQGSLTAGQRVAALDFTVPSVPPQPAGAIQIAKPGDAPATATAQLATSASGAVTTFLDALIARDYANAFAQLSPLEQARVSSPQRLAAETAPFGLIAFTISASTPGSVTTEFVQTARVSDIDGVIAPAATVVFPIATENGVFTVGWSRRTVVSHHPERSATSDSEVSAAVLEWADAAQRCSASPLQYSAGLIGVTGLADRLCKSTGTPVVEAVGDLDALDEPQPVIDGFGSSAMTWARVVRLKEPVDMNVVVAPDAGHWTVIAIARPSLASLAAPPSVLPISAPS